jgi:hypothetical protein
MEATATITDTSVHISRMGDFYIKVALKPTLGIVAEDKLWAYLLVSPRTSYWKTVAKSLLGPIEWSILGVEDRRLVAPDDYYHKAQQLAEMLVGIRVHIRVINTIWHGQLRQEVRWIT